MRLPYQALVLALAAVPLAGALKQPVKTNTGLVSGIPGRDPAIAVFKGIPFAAPPVGNLRWREPRAAAAWQGVRKADQFSSSCIQIIKSDNKPWTYEFMTHNEVSEDCLYLNVWTGAKAASEGRPVYLYIYGGANTEGSAAVPVYDGEGLAKKGIVVVTVNYRLGIFGFFAHPELTKEAEYKASGNYALLDLVAALHWVRDNIAAFGGDPAKVTIGGQSAGGANTYSLLASPLAKGLFRGAIVESGGGGSRPLAELEQVGAKFAEAKGAGSLADLRRMSWKDLIAPVPGAPPFRFSTAALDGYVLRDQSEPNGVPMLTGINMHEGGATPHPEVTVAGYEQQVRRRFPDLADEVLKFYPAATDEAARAAQNELAWDAARVSMYVRASQRAQKTKTKVYTYFWDHALPGPDAEKYGAFHSSEVPYVMGALAMSDRPFTAADQQIAGMMTSYWANFIATGDPNGKGLAHWPSVEEKPDFTMEVGDKTAAIPTAGSEAKRKLLEKQFARP
ncbi:MAG TPA: carboxylesterase family protein [Candidatus Acidoferrales bacterium]|nr:carboxylesterase family protein [Candidatus Acidoferrales bacterium]